MGSQSARRRGELEVTLLLRRGDASDATAVGEICYRAFKAVAEAHNFPPDIPSVEMAVGVLTRLINDAGHFSMVAEIDGKIVGSNFLDERNSISGVGPITVDPLLQNDGVGHALMQSVIHRSQERRFAGIRLVQAAYHNRSLALYLKLGFDVREQLACLQGPAVGKGIAGHLVRSATQEDLPACNRLCFRVHGHDRGGELASAIHQRNACVVEHGGRITGYATPVAFFGHAVGETNDDLKALIGIAKSFSGPGFLVPTRNGELMRWCLGEGLRIAQTMTLMTNGLYNSPKGPWLPSVVY
jgi:predicted N-acetyltransferase YhbS